MQLVGRNCMAAVANLYTNIFTVYVPIYIVKEIGYLVMVHIVQQIFRSIWPENVQHSIAFKLKILLFSFSHKLLEILMLSRQNRPRCPPFQFYTMQLLWNGTVQYKMTAAH